MNYLVNIGISVMTTAQFVTLVSNILEMIK